MAAVAFGQAAATQETYRVPAGVQVSPVAPSVHSAPEPIVCLQAPHARAPMARSAYALAAGGAALHLLFSGRYGFFRDELYYLACGQRLAWGYVDHAPLVAFLARLQQVVLGNSLYAARVLPTLAHAALILLTAWIARELGGGRFAQGLAALLALIAPIYLTFGSFLSMNAFEPLFWMGCTAIFLRIRNGGSGRMWLLFGLVAGLGILNKHSMLMFGSGIAAGLLLTSARREFAKPWTWAGAGLAFAIFAPNLVWEFRHGFPTIALLRAAVEFKYTSIPAWQFVAQQALLAHPLTVPVWIAGLWFLFRARKGRYAALGWSYVIVLAEMIALHGKIYYQAPAYPMLFAAGAVLLESQRIFQNGVWAKAAVIAPLVIGGAIAAPLAMPVLPVETAALYCRFWDVQSVRVENVPQGELPQLFGDMFGWPEQVEALARVYGSLRPSQRGKAAILAYNYGEAAAVDVLGGKYALPKAVSGHNQYALWGPGEFTGETVVAIGFTEEKLRALFEEVTPAGQVFAAHAIPEETGVRIFVCRRARKPLRELWPQLSWLG